MPCIRTSCNLAAPQSRNVFNVNTAKVTDMSYMFFQCNVLTSLDVSEWNTSNVTNMRSMFYDCEGLTNLDVSKWNTSNVTNMSDMFNVCKGLMNLDVSNFNTSKVTNMHAMFYYCEKLTSLDISSFDTSNVTDMTWMFGDCTGLTNIYVGKNWNTDKVTNGGNMFWYCPKLPNYSSSKVDVMAATFTTNGGYLTYKAATKSLKLNVDQSGTVNGYTEQSAA